MDPKKKKKKLRMTLNSFDLAPSIFFYIFLILGLIESRKRNYLLERAYY